MQTPAQERARVLATRLSTHGLEPRPDSRIQSLYIKGDITDVEYVVDLACEMNWLYKYTDFSSRLADMVEVYAREYGGYHDGIYTKCSDWLRTFYTRPEVWPWQPKESQEAPNVRGNGR